MKSFVLMVIAVLLTGVAQSEQERLTQPSYEVLNPEYDGRIASGWTRIEIPGALCGDGSAYPVFVKPGPHQNKKVLMILKGGGACWNRSTCSNGIYTKLQAQEKMKGTSAIFSIDPKKNAFAQHSKIFFTYCNGDVFLGNHDANYGGKKVKHHGRRNVEKAIRYLTQQGHLDLSVAEEFVMYGYSAGAVGGLFHAMEVDPLLLRAEKKILISDSPGLHFGDTFWDKFSSTMTDEYMHAIEQTGARVERGQGNLSMAIPKLCEKLDDWTIGVLQGTRDWIMSKVFGNISKSEHEKLVLGPDGLYAHTQNPNDNCSSWIKSTSKHVFLTTSSGAGTAIGRVSAMKYAQMLSVSGAGRNHAELPKKKRKKRDRKRR